MNTQISRSTSMRTILFTISGGSGRQSLARLATYVLEFKVFMIEVSKHYRRQVRWLHSSTKEEMICLFEYLTFLAIGNEKVFQVDILFAWALYMPKTKVAENRDFFVYLYQEFRDDLRALYRQTGVEYKPTVFIFNDTQVLEESFLEDINNILSSGEVPNLYKPEEFEEVNY